ncbi:hypothetical protein C8A01DRAFT_39735 [Parachaetomium inaequale]|uniref:Uncharacterized protein n=1 Tax=Parachaetomium inaequale TaxID=2588326 RepID=A0AAN6SMF5_9PEZI|nr:hypothetical protein C8A01DRAFT_39735 [Parachaetomium inaequale]
MSSKNHRPSRGRSSQLATPGPDPEDALHKLEAMIDLDCKGAIKRFHEYHHNHDRTLNITVEEATAVLSELGRSKPCFPSNHTFWKLCTKSLRTLATWKGHHDSFQEIRKHGMIPSLPTPQSLLALRYLNPKDPSFPALFVAEFQALGLEWYLRSEEPLAWWAGALLDDKDFRKKNIAKTPETNAPPFDVEELLRVVGIVLKNWRKPRQLEEHADNEAAASEGELSFIAVSSSDGGASSESESLYLRTQSSKRQPSRKYRPSSKYQSSSKGSRLSKRGHMASSESESEPSSSPEFASESESTSPNKWSWNKRKSSSSGKSALKRKRSSKSSESRKRKRTSKVSDAGNESIVGGNNTTERNSEMGRRLGRVATATEDLIVTLGAEHVPMGGVPRGVSRHLRGLSGTLRSLGGALMSLGDHLNNLGGHRDTRY